MFTYRNHLMGVALIALSASVMLSACSEDLALKQAKQGWTSGSDVDPNNTWITSNPVQINVTSDTPGSITAQSIMKQQTTIFGDMNIKDRGVMHVDVPQGEASSFGLVFKDSQGRRQYKRIDLTGDPHQVVNVNFKKADDEAASMKKAPMRKADGSNYHFPEGVSMGWTYFPEWTWNDVTTVFPLDGNINTTTRVLKDLEFVATGQVTADGTAEDKQTIYVTPVYVCSARSYLYLGYYYYKEDSPTDLKHAYIIEVTNGYSKCYGLQYESKANEGTWVEPGGNINTISDVSSIRGETFKIEIPKGYKYGFTAICGVNAVTVGMKTIMDGLGVPTGYPSRAERQAFYTNATWNMGSAGEGMPRAGLAVYDGMTLLGFDGWIREDAIATRTYSNEYKYSRPQCNDFVVALTDVNGNQLLPKLSDRARNSSYNAATFAGEYGDAYKNTVNDPTEAGSSTTEDTYEKRQHWTLAFENAGLDDDYDMNDVVLEITPMGNEKAAVYLMAAGAMRKTEVYYDGQLLGEVHDLFGVPDGEMVNTTKVTLDPVLLSENLNWPMASMEANLNKFSLKVYDKDGSVTQFNRQDMLTNVKNSKSPQVLCVAGRWAWPKERVKVSEAYPILSDWATNFSNADYFNWHSLPAKDLVVTPRAPKR